MNIPRAALLCLVVALAAACDDAPCSTDADCFSGEVCREDGKCRQASAADLGADLDMSSPDLDMSSPDLDEPDPDLGSPDMDTQGSCDGITCSGAGTCVITDGLPACACEPGYVASGLTCALTTPTAVSAGAQHTCAIAGGKLYCWGDNAKGQLGVGDLDPRSTPTPVRGMDSDVTAVAAGGQHTCAIKGARLHCWGDHANGQVGTGSAGALTFTNPQPITLPSPPTSVTAGGAHTCAIAADSAAYCWGGNRYGQLGDGTLDKRTTPTAVDAMLAPAQISAGDLHTCAVVRGQVKCWGAGANGRLGNNEFNDLTIPKDILPNATAVAAGGRHTCAITNILRCWGSNEQGQLGDPGVPPGGSPNPTPTAALDPGVAQIATGHNHTCAVQNDTLYCWGDNSSGQSGQGPGSMTVGLPNIVADIPTPTQITAGGRHTCAIADGALYCWGSNAQGQLGTASPNNTSTPTLITLP